jgi:hypothetical protein
MRVTGQTGEQMRSDPRKRNHHAEHRRQTLGTAVSAPRQAVHDHVQLDRLTGTSAERHGDWPDPQKALALPAAKGDSLPDHVPTLTVLR